MNIDDIIENAQLKGRVIALDAEVKCLEAVIRAHERVDCLSVTSLKKQLVEAEAENARLKAEVEKWEKNTQLMGRQLNDELEQVARLKAEVERLEKEVWRMKVFKGIDEDTTATLKDALNTVPEWAKVLETEAENARLKAECQARQAENSVLAVECDSLKAEVERLKLTPKTFGWTDKTYIDKVEFDKLQAQVERLTEAGDNMAFHIGNDEESQYKCADEWRAAKGVQS